MLSGKGKRVKKATVFGKALGMLKPKKDLIHKSKPEPRNTISTLAHNVSQINAEEDDVSQQFDPDLVRLSVMAGDPWDQFSLADSDKNYSSDDHSLFAEEGEDKEVLNTSEGANDEVYLDDNTSSGSVDRVDEQEGSASDEEEGEDTFDMSSEVAFQRNHVNAPTARGVAVTDSVIAFTTGSTLAASMNQIERIMEVNDNHQEHVCIEHEDSSALLDQLHRALRSSVVSMDPGPPKAVDELESEFEMEMHEADRLVRELEASRLTTKALEEKINSRKAKMQNIEEIGEQVHMARAFALQSVKLKSFTLSSHKSSTKLKRPSKETSLDSAIIQEEGSSDESDQDSGAINQDNAEQKDNLCRSDEKLHISHDDTTYSRETPGTNQTGSSNGNGVSKPPAIEDELFSPYEDELSDAVETAIAREADEDRKDRSEGFQETSVDKDFVRGRANSAAKSPDEKLRTSIQKAIQMEEVGDQVRQGRFQEFGEVELAIAGQGQEHGQIGVNAPENAQQSEMFKSELLELRARLHEQQQQIEYLEQERSYNVSKVAELNTLVQRAGSGDVMQHLAEKSVQVAELNHEISILRAKLARSEDRSTALEAERDANKTVILNLSESLWKNDSMNGSTNKATNAFIKQGGVIPANDAMEMTIAHLQTKIETLEDENAAYKETVESLTASVLELTQENDARMLKIAALESQFLMLNKRGPSTSVVVSATSLDSPGSQQNNEKLLRFKAWANNKINQVQEQYDNIKTDIEIRRVNTDPDQILT